MDQGESMAVHLLNRGYQVAAEYKRKYGLKLYMERPWHVRFKCDSCGREKIIESPLGWKIDKMRCESCSGMLRITSKE